MAKNDRLAANVITPTTKAESHDVPISPAEIVEGGHMSQADWDKVCPDPPNTPQTSSPPVPPPPHAPKHPVIPASPPDTSLSPLPPSQVSAAALALFQFGQEQAALRGLLLVDTKYEFGKGADGEIYLIDEVCICVGEGGPLKVLEGGGACIATRPLRLQGEGKGGERRGGEGSFVCRIKTNELAAMFHPHSLPPPLDRIYRSTPLIRAATGFPTRTRRGMLPARSPRTSTRSSCGCGSDPCATRTRMRWGRMAGSLTSPECSGHDDALS